MKPIASVMFEKESATAVTIYDLGIERKPMQVFTSDQQFVSLLTARRRGYYKSFFLKQKTTLAFSVCYDISEINGCLVVECGSHETYQIVYLYCGVRYVYRFFLTMQDLRQMYYDDLLCGSTPVSRMVEQRRFMLETLTALTPNFLERFSTDIARCRKCRRLIHKTKSDPRSSKWLCWNCDRSERSYIKTKPLINGMLRLK